MEYDVVIIGGGAAGQMAAISVKRHHPDYSVLLLDRTFALGRKILVCGAGRCNITNINLEHGVTGYYYGASTEFIEKVFGQFTFNSIVDFFNELGVELYIERKTDIGKMFPVTNQAQTVTAVLLDELNQLGVEIRLSTAVDKLKRTGSEWHLTTQTAIDRQESYINDHIIAKNVIIAAGGKTYPALGSNGSGYELAEQLGHKIIQPVPSALPLEASNKLIHLSQGIKLDATVTSIIDNKRVKSRTDDVMFTKHGISGPAVLNISREVAIHFHRDFKNNCQVELNFLPEIKGEEVASMLEDRWSKRPKLLISHSLYGLLPNKFADAITEFSGLAADALVEQLSADQKELLIQNLTQLTINITGTRGWNEAEFTAGGVDTTDIDPATMASLLQPGLYFAGEIVDVDGDVGGFNLSWSWASGWVAGKLIDN